MIETDSESEDETHSVATSKNEQPVQTLQNDSVREKDTCSIVQASDSLDSSILEEHVPIITQFDDLLTDHKTLLHIYTFVARCISYDSCNIFVASDVIHYSSKVSTVAFQKIKNDFARYVESGNDLVLGDAVYALNKLYYDKLICDERIFRCVDRYGISYSCLRDMYEAFLNQYIDRGDITEDEKPFIMAAFKLRCKASGNRVENFVEFGKWSKDELYEMFQKVLSTEKKEALTIYNACRVSKKSG